MNSLKSIREAIESERVRQIQVLESGGVVVQETRGWDEVTGSTISMRSKEEAQDYRYFPEPDLPSLVFSAEDVAKVDAELPELPAARRERYGKQFGLDQVTLEYLTSEAFYGEFFEQTVQLGADAGEVAKWMSNTVSRLSNELETPLRDSKLTPASLGELLKLIDSGEVGAKSGQRVLEVLFSEGGDAGAVTDKLGLRQMSSSDSLKPILLSVIESNQPVVQQIKEGNEKALNVLVGKVMKETRGAANPGLTKTMLEELISASD